MLGVIQQCLDPWLSEAPGASIQWLLLSPNDVLCVRVAVKILFQLLPGERVQLLDARDCDIFDLVVGTVLDERSIDLSGAENDSVDLVA